ncbi:MAG TPA: cell division protein FtsZ [Rhodospirillales bacterium]
MSINLTVPETSEKPKLKPKLTVIGVGGAGGNAVNNMIRAELEGVDFVVANTDAQALSHSNAERRIQLGATLTQGLGAGSRPEIGRAAAEEALEDIIGAMEGSHMAFVAAGMGGGTGTGAAPIIARAAKELGILTVGVVTKPFQFEGTHRMRQAEAGIEDLEQFVDTLIVIPNQNLFRIANEKTTFADAFAMADEVLYSGVRGVTDLMVMPGLINLDFADIRTVMSEMGKAMMGTGEAEGERRALDAAEAAIANPLLDDMSMKGAKGVLINITGGMDITLFEVDEAANRIRAEVDQDAYIIVGSAFDAQLDGKMRVSVVATGIDADASEMPLPRMLHLAEQIERPAKTIPLPQPKAQPVPAAEINAEPTIETKAEVPVDAPAEAAELPVIAAVEPAAEEKKAETPPTAMPAIGAVDAFIPPKPVAASDEEESKPVDPFAVAAMTNGGRRNEAETSTPARTVSLFERVTGAGRPAFGRKIPSLSRYPEVTEKKELSDTKETQAAAPALQPVAAPGPAEAVAPEAEEDEELKLGGLDPADRLPSSESDDDLLDIPAFLRRQAN